jgi:toxin ParE1/3/4
MAKRESQARIRPLAATDLERMVKYLDSCSQDAGDRFLDEFFEATIKLAEMPGMGPARRVRGRLKGLRSWSLKKFGDYLVFYLPVDVGIEVIRVLHGAQDIDRELRKRASSTPLERS